MTTTEWLLFVHVLFAIVWIGGGTLLTIFAFRARRAPLAHKLELGRSAEIAGQIFMASSLIVLAMGIWMVLDVDGFEFSQAWIIIGITGLVLSALLGILFFGPQSKALAAAYEAGNEAGGDSILDRIRMVSILDLAILFVVVWAMVAKPGF